MKHLRFLVLAALVAMPLTACDDDNGKSTEPPITGTISGTVAVEGTGLSGVNVALVGPTSGSVTTGAGGAYSFTGVEAGSYAVAIVGFELDDIIFGTQTKTITITTAGQVVTVDFAGSYIRTANISGTVRAEGEGALAGVAVTLTGPEGAKNAVTDEAGHYSVSGLRKGDYTVAITVPEGYTFANDSYQVSVGVGEAKEVSFFGEADVVVDPVTANVVIKSVTNALTGATINPNNVTGQVDITVQVDPGQNDLQKVCVLLDGAEIANGCQTLGSAVAEEQLQSGVLEIVFTIFTNDFDGTTGAPVYANDTYELSAVLSLENAQQSNVTTSMNLTFKNTDMVTAVFTPEFQAVVEGEYVVGGLITVKLMPTLYSGKTLSSMDVEFYWDDFTVDGPFPATEEFVYVYDDYGFDNYYDEGVWVGNGEFSDGTLATISTWATLAGTTVTDVNFDYEPAYFDYSWYLTDQVNDPELACCSQNWVGPDYMPGDGVDSDDPYDELVGVDHYMFVIDAFADLDDDDLEVLLDDDAIDFTSYASVASDGTMADAGLELSLNNDDHDICAVVWDKFGQWSWECLSGDEGSNDEPLIFGYDDTAPTNQEVEDQPPTPVIYNIADATAAIDLGGLNVSASEDRSGFSSVPFRGYIQWWDAEDTEYVFADDADDGGALNTMLPIESCTVAGAMPCYPDWDTGYDGVFYITGSMNNQAGVTNATMIEGWVYNDQTAPTVNANVSVPAYIYLGQPMAFSVPVEDNLHLGSTAFGFHLTGGFDVWYPLGGNIPNGAGDQDPWDGNFPTEETASISIDPAIMGVQSYPGFGAAARYDAVRAIHTDLAGNVSGVSSNNILATSFSDTPGDFSGADIAAFGVTMPDAAVNLCNGQGLVECDTDVDETEIDLEIVAQGPAGSFANPFATGELYIYLSTDDDSSGTISDGDNFYIVDILNATSAAITDEGVGGNRYYTWTYTLTSDDVAKFADGTNIYIHVMGLKYSNGTALLDTVGNGFITVIDGS
jgi:hypothetical protein